MHRSGQGSYGNLKLMKEGINFERGLQVGYSPCHLSRNMYHAICVFRREFREVLCDVEEEEHDAMIDRSVGVIRHLSYHEERHDLEQLRLRPVSGKLGIVDVSDGGQAAPLWATGETDASIFGSTLSGADAVWSKLLEALSSRDRCANPPCRNVSCKSRPRTVGLSSRPCPIWMPWSRSLHMYVDRMEGRSHVPKLINPCLPMYPHAFLSL